MSLPPVTVHIKRKATDEPVDFLRVHEENGKRRRRATDFVFHRQQISEPGFKSSEQSAPRSVRRIKEIRRAVSAQPLATQPKPPTNELGTLYTQASGQLGGENNGATVDGAKKSIVPVPTTDSVLEQHSTAHIDTTQTTPQVTRPRRFHLSRSSTPILSRSPAGGIPDRRMGNNGHTALFIERQTVQRLSQDVDKVLGDRIGQATQGSVLSTPSQATNKQINNRPRPQKKPGLAARQSVLPKKSLDLPRDIKVTEPVAPSRNACLPWDVSSDQLAAEMQAYTLQEIGHNLAESEASKLRVTTPTFGHHKGPKSRFKPKKPALRYHERHPEEASTIDNASKIVIERPFADQEDMSDDTEYIIDTYIRIPADVMETSDSLKNIGLLVLDSQPDIDEFYREKEDNEEEEEEEEEDENAENHYSADYPDEEVESDDEYGRNPYLYYNHNASDLEEFDEDDARFSDEDNGGTHYPWVK